MTLTKSHVHHAGAAEALRLAAGEDAKKYGQDGVARKLTEVEQVVIRKETDAEHIVEALPASDVETKTAVELFLPESLQKDCVFVGHVVTDLDSVAGAIGAAALYGGTAALASKVNSETQFALDYWKVTEDPTIGPLLPVEQVLQGQPDAKICLVDHQQTSQMNPAVLEKSENIVGVIDHHALQNKTIVTDKPIFIDIRPWGSMSTIIAHTFLTHKKRPTKAVAGLLLCAILSDTLNLLGPTTTEWDRLMVAVLAEITELDDIQLLASQQFKAKSKELANTSAYGLVNGDQKTFSMAGPNWTGDIGFAVVETTDDQVILDKVEELLPELVACKKEKNLNCLFLAIVNIVQLKSCLLICGPGEKSLAQAAFDGPMLSESVMDLGKRVSRKKDFIPILTSTVKQGWTKPTTRGPSDIRLDLLGHLEVDPNDPHHNVQRKGCALESPKHEKKRKIVSMDQMNEHIDDVRESKKQDVEVVSDGADEEVPQF